MRNVREISVAQLRNNYRRTFDTQDAQMVLEHLKVCFGFYNTTHVKGDPYDTAFFEGQRSVILHLMKMLEEQKKPKQIEGLKDE